MAYTTHEKIRVESGFQSRFIQVPFTYDPDGTTSSFFVESDDRVKFVPEFNTGGTIAGLSDIQVYLGLSGTGSSILQVTSINEVSGQVVLNAAPPTGSSLTVSYASSAVASYEVEEARKRAEATINNRLSLCYDLPLQVNSAHITRLATELAKAFLLIRNYGTASRDTAADGYMLYNQLMGENEAIINRSSNTVLASHVGEIGLICTQRYQLVDDDGNIIPRNDEGVAGSNNSAYVVGGRVAGRLYDITEENFRYKQYQVDVNVDQVGSAKNKPDASV